MKGPVLILCDLHLGHKVSRIEDAECLRGVIRGAGTVVFNGDTWQELAKKYRDHSAAMLADLQRICAEEGAECFFISGNHDPGWDAGWLELAGGRIVVTHGDTLLHSGAPWKREILRNGKRVDEMWKRHPRAAEDIRERIIVAREIAREMRSVEHPAGKSIWQRAWDAAFPPQRALLMIDSWVRHARLGDAFCERYFPQAEILVVGHFHFHGVWHVGRRVVINGGSFLNPDKPRWIEWHNGWLREGRIRETPQGCSRGPVKHVWRMMEK